MKLHQVLAMYKAVKPTAYAELTAAHQRCQKTTFFEGLSRTYTRINDEDTQLPPETKRVQVTADEMIAILRNTESKILNMTTQIDETNMVARADVIVDGVTIMTGVPAMTLLFLEKQLLDVRKYISSIPVLDEAETWTASDLVGQFKSVPVQTRSTRKITEPLVLYHATPEHPAQTQTITVDKVVGYWESTKLSGAMSSRRRSEILAKLESLLVAVKVAREEANSIEAARVRDIGGLVFSYLLG